MKVFHRASVMYQLRRKTLELNYLDLSPSPSLHFCVTFDKSLNLSVLWFHLQNRDDTKTYRVVDDYNKLSVKHSE